VRGVIVCAALFHARVFTRTIDEIDGGHDLPEHQAEGNEARCALVWLRAYLA